MKKIKEQLVLFVITFVCLITLIPIKVNAASFNVTAKNNGDGSTTVTVGGEVVGKFSINVNGQTSVIYIDNIGDSKDTKFKTGAGTFQVVVKAENASDANYNLISGQQETVSVKVTAPSTNNGGGNSGNNGSGNSGNNESNNSGGGEVNPPQKPEANLNLSKFQTNIGEISPKYSNSVNKYSINLPAKTSSITFNIKPEDNSVQISGNGEHKLNSGDNKISITIYDAFANSSRKITINVYVEEVPEVFLDYENTKLGIFPNLKDAKNPEGFKPTKITINEIEVNALKNDKGLVLLYMMDETKNKSFYIFDLTSQKILSKYQPIKVNEKLYFSVKCPDDLKEIVGLSKGTITIDDNVIDGWKFDDSTFKNYFLLYLMNEKGISSLYQYEKTENTLQLYSGAVALTQDNIEQLQVESGKNEKMILICFGVIGVLFLILIFVGFKCYQYKKLVFRKKARELNEENNE